MAASRRPNTQATTRRLARSTANHSQTLRRLRPTNVYISSSSRASQRFCCAFFDRRRGSAGLACCAFFCQFGHGHARHAGYPHDASLRIALGQQRLDLALAGGPLGGGGHKTGLVPAPVTAVASMPTAVAIAMNLLAAAFGARVLSHYHQLYTKPILTYTTAKNSFQRVVWVSFRR